jgi:hypothetical protein
MNYQNAKICDNNHLDQSTVTVVESSPFVFTNALDLKNRNKLWKPGSKSFTIQIDLLSNSKNVSFFALLGASNSLFSLSNQATVTIKANSINLFTGGEPLSESVTVGELGAYINLSDSSNQDGVNYRYWEIDIEDSFNPDDLEFAYIYLGDNTIIHRNINNGFTYTNLDRTLSGTSDSGKVYTLQKPEQTFINAMSYQIMSSQDKTNLLTTIRRIGLHTPFLFALDPDECREDFDFGVRPVYFNRAVPTLTHVVRNYYSARYSLREVL